MDYANFQRSCIHLILSSKMVREVVMITMHDRGPISVKLIWMGYLEERVSEFDESADQQMRIVGGRLLNKSTDNMI